MLIISTRAVAEIIQAVSAASIAGRAGSASAPPAPAATLAAASPNTSPVRRNVLIMARPPFTSFGARFGAAISRLAVGDRSSEPARVGADVRMLKPHDPDRPQRFVCLKFGR